MTNYYDTLELYQHLNHIVDCIESRGVPVGEILNITPINSEVSEFDSYVPNYFNLDNSMQYNNNEAVMPVCRKHIFMHIPYNIVKKVKCEISTYEYITDINKYLKKLRHYQKLYKNLTDNENSIKASSVLDIKNIVKVYKIYLDFPYFTTIKISSLFVNGYYEDLIEFYRKYGVEKYFIGTPDNLIPVYTNNGYSEQFENILFTEQNGYKTVKYLDLYKSIIFLYNVVYKTTNCYNTKNKIKKAINDNEIERSEYTDRVITYEKLSNMHSAINKIIKNIHIRM